MAPWKARKIAQATHHLSKAGAASVDAQLADRIGSCGWRAIETAVAQAIATYDPHLLETREKQGKDAWGVRLFHRGVGTDGGDTGPAPPIWRSPATPSTSPPFTTWSVTRPPN